MRQQPEPQLERLQKLATKALTFFDISADTPLTLINHRENAVFRVDDIANARRYVLRVHRAGYQTERTIRSELQWMDALHVTGIQTPQVVIGTNGETVQTVSLEGVPGPRHCDLLHWIEGSPPDPGKTETYRLLGNNNARLHQHARTWKRPSWFKRQSWDEEGMLGAEPLWGRFSDLEVLTDKQLDLLSEARDVARKRLLDFGKAQDRYGLIHADFMADNILVQDGIPQVIDFDDCGFGWFLYDFATLLALIWDEQEFRAVHDAWLEGYRSVEPLPDDHLLELPTLIMCRCLVGLGWTHTRRETPLAREFTAMLVELACTRARSFLDT